MNRLTVKLGDVSVEKSDSDAVLRTKAEKHLPKALKLFGEKAAQELWREVEKSGLKFNNDKTKFIRDTAEEFVKKVTTAEKTKVTEDIFQQLKAERNAKG